MTKDILNTAVANEVADGINDGVYCGKISKVALSKEPQTIVVTLTVVGDDDMEHRVFLRTSVIPEYSYSMINRLCECCETRIPSEFVGTEVWVSIKINEIDSIRKYTNVVDIIKYDESISDDLTINDKGYFEYY